MTIAALVAFIRVAAFFYSAVCVVAASTEAEGTAAFSPQAVIAMAASRMAACFSMFVPFFECLRVYERR
jgi:hypothetical protein